MKEMVGFHGSSFWFFATQLYRDDNPPSCHGNDRDCHANLVNVEGWFNFGIWVSSSQPRSKEIWLKALWTTLIPGICFFFSLQKNESSLKKCGSRGKEQHENRKKVLIGLVGRKMGS